MALHRYVFKEERAVTILKVQKDDCVKNRRCGLSESRYGTQNRMSCIVVNNGNLTKNECIQKKCKPVNEPTYSCQFGKTSLENKFQT